MADDDPKEEAESEDAKNDEASDAESESESEEGGAVKKRFRPSKKILLMAVPPVLLLLGGGGYFGATSLGLFKSDVEKAAMAPKTLYYDLPEMVVNLSSGEQRVQYLKLKVALETSDQLALDALQPVMPRVLDTFQLYLRELRSTDLEGSAGIFRLKEELLRRINHEIHPNQINRVLFKEIIVQ